MSKLFVYRASAGSGKTFRLAAEYLKLAFLNPENYNRILAVTFTNKATNEMKGRIVKELYSLAQGEITAIGKEIVQHHKLNNTDLKQRAQQILSLILHDYSNFSVSTIDSFVQRVIQSLLWEMGQQGRFEIELNTHVVLEQAADNLLDSSPNNPETLKWMSSMINSRLEAGSSWDIRSELVSIGNQLFSETFRLMDPKQVELLTSKQLIEGIRKAAKSIIEVKATQIQTLANEILTEIEKHGLIAENFVNGKKGFISFVYKCSRFNPSQKDLIDTKSSYLQKAVSDPTGTDWVKADTRKKPELFIPIGSFVSTYLHGALNNLCALVEGEELKKYTTAHIVLQNLGNLGLLADLWSESKKISKTDGILLLSDSHHLLREFVKETDAPFVFEKMGTRYEHFLIDEFQDTSVVQWENFRPLINNGLAQGKMSMVVGDVKQSIYRWRNSDWRILGQKIFDDFTPPQIEEKHLSTNFRSAQTIIDFNNQFFENAAQLCCNKIAEMLEKSDTNLSENLTQQIEKAYNDIKQTAATKHENAFGKVEISMLEANTSEAYNAAIGPKLIDLLISLSKKYSYGEIAILFRQKKEGVQIANLLVEHNRRVLVEQKKINFISQDGLLLNSSAAVRLIVAALRVIYDSGNEICKREFARELETLNQQSVPQWHQTFASTSIETEISWLNNLEFSPIQEVFEGIVNRYQLNAKTGELAYIAELHEFIITQSAKTGSDLYRFLEWWDEKSGSTTLTVPEASDAITLITIHKAKGLQFPVVIIPYANWSFSPSNNDSINWVSTHMEPFNSLPYYPIKLYSIAQKSYFQHQYFENIMHQIVDNLNLLYVAFTRAETELHIFCQSTNTSNNNSFSKIGEIISLVIPQLNLNLTEDQQTQVKTYTAINSNPERIRKDISQKNEKWEIQNYSSVLTIPKIRINRQKSALHINPSNELQKPAMHGKLMHLIFSCINTENDIDTALNQFEIEGIIDSTESNLLNNKIRNSLQKEPLNLWFSNRYRILNERTLLTPQGSMYRPDRVMLSESETIVVDFKFGEVQPQHKNQVVNYCKLLQTMGYPKVQGYLWYFDSNNLQNV